ncbi:MAG: RnfABCDGE type electron transport complex subunit G [Candidatus Cryptobacteroides sp.]
MAIQSSFKNMLVCLTTICLVCSALLAGVYAVTAEPIAAAALKKTNDAVAAVLPEFAQASEEKSVLFEGKECKYYEVYDGEGVVMGYAIKSAEGGFGGPVSLMVGVLSDGTVYNTNVLSHAETPGLGAKCTEPSFHDQFIGLDPSVTRLDVKQKGGDIDAITAATITSNAYTKAVAKAVAIALVIKEGPEVEEVEPVTEGGSENE